MSIEIGGYPIEDFPELSKELWGLIPNARLWESYYSQSIIGERSALTAEITAAELLSQNLGGTDSNWKLHGNGHISRKFDRGIDSAYLVIDVHGTVSNRLIHDNHLNVYLVPWLEGEPHKGANWESTCHSLKEYKICVLPSYRAAACDSCLAIVLATEDCEIEDMFDLIPGTRRQLASRLRVFKRDFVDLLDRIPQVRSRANEEISASWRLDRFDKLTTIHNQHISSRGQHPKSPSSPGEFHQPLGNLSRRANQLLHEQIDEHTILEFRRIGQSLSDTIYLVYHYEFAICTLERLYLRVIEFPDQLGGIFDRVFALFLAQSWERGRRTSEGLKTKSDELRALKARRDALESRARGQVGQCETFLSRHESLSEIHGENYSKALLAIEEGRFEQVHNLLKPLINDGNSMDTDEIIQSGRYGARIKWKANLRKKARQRKRTCN